MHPAMEVRQRRMRFSNVHRQRRGSRAIEELRQEPDGVVDPVEMARDDAAVEESLEGRLGLDAAHGVAKLEEAPAVEQAVQADNVQARARG